MPKQTNNLQLALDYSNKGWFVFPLAPKDKHPITLHGCKDATTDKETIVSWWTQTPEANIGIATGSKSGIFVLDIDIKNEIDGNESLKMLIKEFGEIPKTIESITGTGGRHLFFSALHRIVWVDCGQSVRMVGLT